MYIKSKNKLDPKYGFSEREKVDKKNFYGHQVGIALCLKNNVTGEIEQDFVPGDIGKGEERKKAVQSLLNDESLEFVMDKITQFDKTKKELVPKTIYYLPYVVEGHSSQIPTVVDDNISGASNVSYSLDVEVLLVEDDLKRYLTLHFKTRNIPVFNLVYDLFEDDDEEELAAAGIKKKKYDDEYGYYIQFYDDAGNCYPIIFSSAEEIRDKIISMRLIGIDCKID